MITVPFHRWIRVTLFTAFAAVLFAGTHWPQLRIEGPIPRPDLVVHLVAFTVWSLLLCVSGILGESGRLATSGRCFVAGLVYAAFDESTQMIPMLGRYAAIDDYLFNATGLAIGCLMATRVHTKSEPKPLRQ